MLKKGVPFPHHSSFSFLSLECMFSRVTQNFIFFLTFCLKLQSKLCVQQAILLFFFNILSSMPFPFHLHHFLFYSSHFGCSLLCASCLCRVHFYFTKQEKMRIGTYFGFLSCVPQGKVSLRTQKTQAMARSRKIIMILTASEIFDANFVMLSDSFTVKKTKRILCSLVKLVKCLLTYVRKYGCVRLWCHFEVLSGRQTNERTKKENDLRVLCSFFRSLSRTEIHGRRNRRQSIQLQSNYACRSCVFHAASSNNNTS